MFYLLTYLLSYLLLGILNARLMLGSSTPGTS